MVAKIGRYSQPRRGKSRNKVAVGEPAAGSFLESSKTCGFFPLRCFTLWRLSHNQNARAAASISYWTTLSDGYLGSVIDEGRSKARHVSRLADSRELTNFSMQIAARLYPVGHALQSVIAHAIHCALSKRAQTRGSAVLATAELLRTQGPGVSNARDTVPSCSVLPCGLA